MTEPSRHKVRRLRPSISLCPGTSSSFIVGGRPKRWPVPGGSSVPGTGSCAAVTSAGKARSAAFYLAPRGAGRNASLAVRSATSRPSHGARWSAPVASANAAVSDRFVLRLKPSKTTVQRSPSGRSIKTLPRGVGPCQLGVDLGEAERRQDARMTGALAVEASPRPFTAVWAWARAGRGGLPRRRRGLRKVAGK